MGDFKRIALEKESKLKVSAESKYWSKFSLASITKEVGSVSSIDFANNAPHNYAVTSSTRVRDSYVC
jgi:hypothetical protein